jgi:dephospho-CoA kinase
MKTGITGGIGSGKSYVCKLLSERGIDVYDCDSAAKRLMRTSTELRQQLTTLIGPAAYVKTENDSPLSWTLNKAVVAQFLLASEANAQAIDAIVHPAVFHDFEESGKQWMESAILFESGINRLVDRVVVVTAPEAIRVERIVKRDGISPEKAKEWINRQWSQEKVRQLADFEIINDGRPLEPQIERLLNSL